MSLALDVFVTGATGYLGRSLVPELLARGQRVTALVRAGKRTLVAPRARAEEIKKLVEKLQTEDT